MHLVVRIERWEDPEGVDVKEIGQLKLMPRGDETEVGDYLYTLDEGAHPLGVRPLRDRDTIQTHPRRQSVWALVAQVIDKATKKRVLQ